MMKNFKLLTLILILFVVLNSCKKEKIKTNLVSDYDSEVVIQWYSLIKTLTTETKGFTPPVAARAFGYTGIALYEAVQNGIPDKSSLSGKLTDFTISHNYNDNKKYHWPTVAHTVLAEMTKYFYSSTSKERFDAIIALETKYHDQYSATYSKSIYERSVELAEETSRKIISWSETDGGKDCHLNNFPSSYVPMPGEEYWKPTAPDFLPALQPYWGENRPFLKQNISNTIPPNPPTYSTEINSVFYNRAHKVYQTVNNLTSEQRDIAEFWSDDPVTTATPPGHSISILNQLIEQNNSNLAISSEAFAKLGIGVSDAFIACWKTKYATNYLRPITYIRENIDPNWTPVLVTPPFPEYTSGHSVQSGALAEIMTAFFGENYKFTDKTHQSRTDINGAPRTYDSFYKMAEEAAISRLYGGIHYDEAINLGLEQGYQIGENVVNLDLNK